MWPKRWEKLNLPESEVSTEGPFSSVKRFLSTRQNSSNELVHSYMTDLHEKKTTEPFAFILDEYIVRTSEKTEAMNQTAQELVMETPTQNKKNQQLS